MPFEVRRSGKFALANIASIFLLSLMLFKKMASKTFFCCKRLFADRTLDFPIVISRTFIWGKRNIQVSIVHIMNSLYIIKSRAVNLKHIVISLKTLVRNKNISKERMHWIKTVSKERIHWIKLHQKRQNSISPCFRRKCCRRFFSSANVFSQMEHSNFFFVLAEPSSEEKEIYKLALYILWAVYTLLRAKL